MNRQLFETCGQFGFSKFTELKLSRKNYKTATIVHTYNQNDVFGEGGDYILGYKTIQINF